MPSSTHNRQFAVGRETVPQRRGVRRAAACLAAVAAAALGATSGCVPSYPLAEGELARYWLLTDVSAGPGAAATQPAAPAGKARAGFQMPTRWVIRQQKSLIWSTVSLVRAMDKLKAGTAEVEFSVSPAHARALVNILTQARAALADLREMLETSGRGDRNRWAETLAAALAKMESVSRLVTAEQGARPAAAAGGADEPLGMAAEPMLNLIAQYLDGRSDGGLLADLSPGELKRLRDVLAEMVVRLGFEVVGKEPSADLRKEVAQRMRAAPNLDELKKSLAKLLTDQISQAAPARSSGKKKTVQTVLRWAPKAIKLLESFLSQWDRMESITVELVRGRGGDLAVAVTLAVLPGKQVRIADVMTGLPVIVFRGATRMVVQSDATPAGETVVAFDPAAEGGAVELRFEGLIYGLVKLLALPLASGPLREGRVSSGTSSRGEQLIHVAVLTEASGDRTDPRRMLVVQDSRTKKVLRQAFSVQAVVEHSETVVSYLTPTRRYTYQRIKHAGSR